MRINRGSPYFVLQIVLLVSLLLQISCEDSSPSEERWIHELEKSNQIAENAQKKVETSENQAQNAQQQASFLKGFLITGVIVALVIGVSLGTKAKNDSIQTKEDYPYGKYPE